MTTFVSVEYPNLVALDTLIGNWDSLSLSADQLKPKKHCNKEYQLLSILKKYRKSVRDGVVHVTYEYSDNHHLTGRQFVKNMPSLQGMKRWMRHTISTKYHDYDIVNCHPNIFVQYCKLHGYDVKPFERYLEDRDALLKELMDSNSLSRDQAKEVVLSILNGGSKDFKRLEHKPTWLICFKAAAEDVQLQILGDPANEELVRSVKEHKSYNVQGSVMNHLLCNIENSVLMEAIRFLNVTCPVLMFDGFMSLEKFSSSQLSDLKVHIFEKTGYSLDWCEKTMDEAIDLSGFVSTETLNDMTAFQKVTEKFGTIIKRFQGSTLIFNEANGIWSSKREDVLGLWYKLCQDTLTGTDYGTQVKKQQTIFNLCSTLPDSEDFFERGRRNRLGKLLYKDCVWNIETNSREAFNPEYFFKYVIPRNRGTYNKEAYDEVFKILFVNTQSDEKERNELWKYLSVAATGKHNKRCMVNNIGLSGTGKSTLIHAFRSAFPGYADSVKMSAFIVTNFTKANDHNDDLLKFEHSRWLFTSEQTGVADCELVKSYTGGDFLNPRGCGSKTEKSFYPESLLFTMSNGPLKFNKQDDALLKRIKPFFWKNQFENPCDEAIQILNTVEGYEALDFIIQNGYELWKSEGFLQVESLDALKSDIKGDHESFEDIFERVFKIEDDTKNKNFWIKSTEVYNYFAELKEDDFNIKYKMKEKGIECKQDRGPQGRLTYFKGLSYK